MSTIDIDRVAQTEARIKADEAAGNIAVMTPYEAVVTQIAYLKAVARYAPVSAEVAELHAGLVDLGLLVERLEATDGNEHPRPGRRSRGEAEEDCNSVRPTDAERPETDQVAALDELREGIGPDVQQGRATYQRD